LAVCISAGNENEQRHFFLLIDELLSQELRPLQAWADRGYWSAAIRNGLIERRIEPMISRRRNPHEPIPDGTPTGPIHLRGKKKTRKPRDPMGRHRWQIERTNAWLHNYRRVHIRREVKVENYSALLTLALTLILVRYL
jgi:Transposase DDE domain